MYDTNDECMIELKNLRITILHIDLKTKKNGQKCRIFILLFEADSMSRY